jgi:hypothetical protein
LIEPAAAHNVSGAHLKMLEIMKMVQDNSEIALVNHMAIETDIYRNDPISVQLAHNTDNDCISLFLIRDMASCTIEELPFARLSSNNKRIIQERFGHRNANLNSNSITMFQSLEFRALLREILSGCLSETVTRGSDHS